MGDPQPLIIVGMGKRLRLRNVKLVYAASLPACLQLGVGSQFFVEQEDSVEMLHDADPDLKDLGTQVHYATISKCTCSDCITTPLSWQNLAP